MSRSKTQETLNGFTIEEWVDQLEYKEKEVENLQKMLVETLKRIKRVGDVDFYNAFMEKY